MLYNEEVQGFPDQRILTLRCEFFGLAGHYALRLKPVNADSSAPTTSAYIKVHNCQFLCFHFMGHVSSTPKQVSKNMFLKNHANKNSRFGCSSILQSYFFDLFTLDFEFLMDKSL